MTKPGSAKARGRAFEKRVASRVAEWLGVSFGDEATADVQQSRAGSSQCDVLLSERVKSVFYYWLEVKDRKTLSVPEWLRQVKEAQKRHKDDREPVIVFKEFRGQETYAIVRLDHFLELATNHLNEMRKHKQIDF